MLLAGPPATCIRRAKDLYGLIARRRQPVARDVRTLVVVRLVAFLAAWVMVGGSLLEQADLLVTHPDVLVLSGAVGVGLALLPVVMRARTVRIRRLAFDVSMAVDLLALSLLIHLTGGTASPLLPLVVGWVALGVLAYSGPGALVYMMGVTATVAAQPLLDKVGHSHPTVRQDSLLMHVTVLLIVGVSASLELAARRVHTRQRDLVELAMRDALTGVWNRHAFDQLVEQEAADRRSEAVAVAVLDLDHFKQLNDEFGHVAGDEALAEFARLLERQVREDDQVFRIGGEEFAVLFPATRAGDAYLVLERVRSRIAELRRRGARMPTFSAGVVAGELPGSLERADALMYAAKRAGRDCILTADRPDATSLAGGRGADGSQPASRRVPAR